MSEVAVARLPLVANDSRGNLIRAFKATGCAKCGRRYPEVDWSELHVDHIDPRDKSREAISSITDAYRGGGSMARFHSGTTTAILAELLKCQVLCFECHREKHRGESRPLDGQLALFNGSGGWRY